MGEKVFPDIFAKMVAVFAFWRAVAWGAGSVGAVGLVAGFGGGDEAAGVSVGRAGIIDSARSGVERARRSRRACRRKESEWLVRDIGIRLWNHTDNRAIELPVRGADSGQGLQRIVSDSRQFLIAVFGIAPHAVWQAIGKNHDRRRHQAQIHGIVVQLADGSHAIDSSTGTVKPIDDREPPGGLIGICYGKVDVMTHRALDGVAVKHPKHRIVGIGGGGDPLMHRERVVAQSEKSGGGLTRK